MMGINADGSTYEPALDAAIRILTRDANQMERHATRSRGLEAHVDPDRFAFMLEYSGILRSVVSGLEELRTSLATTSTPAKASPDNVEGGPTHVLDLTANQARMLMNYLDRVAAVDGDVREASVAADGDPEGALDDLLKALVAGCSDAYRASLSPAVTDTPEPPIQDDYSDYNVVDLTSDLYRKPTALENVVRESWIGHATSKFEFTAREPARTRGLYRKVSHIGVEHRDDFGGDALITVKYFAQPTDVLRLPARALRAFAFKTVMPVVIEELEELTYE